MQKSLVIAGVLGLLGIGYFTIADTNIFTSNVTDSSTVDFTASNEAGFEAEPADELLTYTVGRGIGYTLEELRNWERPVGPQRVGLQIGHFENDQVPDELSNLTQNGAGAVAAGYNERDTVEVITRLVAADLEAEGIVVDVLPATVPPGYVADAFVSIHADGNNNPSVRGYKMAGPRRDYSGLSEVLVEELYESYAITGLPIDPSISRRMTAYYAFNWPRFEHAVHPFTPSVIVETGFMSNATDRNFLLNQPEVSAGAIATGIKNYLALELEPEPTPLSLEAPTLPLSGTIECATVREERRNRNTRPCEASLTTSDGNSYLLFAETPIATSSLPYQAIVDGQYMPIQLMDNYFWFHWEVLGVIRVDSLVRN